MRLGLLLAEIGRAQGVQVSAEEMTRAMRAEASRYTGQEAMVMEFFRKNPEAAESLRGPIFEDKVVDYILDQATVEERVVPLDELTAEPEEAKVETAAAGDTADSPAEPPVEAATDAPTVAATDAPAA